MEEILEQENYELQEIPNPHSLDKLRELEMGWKVWALAVDKEENVLAVSGASDTVELFRVEDLWGERECAPTMSVRTAHEKAIRTLDFSESGALLATGSFDGTCGVWRTSSGESLHRLEGPESEVKCARFSEDGERVAFSTRDGSVWVCAIDTEAGSAEIEEILDYSEKDVKSVAWDGSSLITTGYNNEVVVYHRWEDADFGEVKWEIEAILEDHSSTVWDSARVDAGGEAYLGTCSESGAVIVYKRSQGRWAKASEYAGSVFPVRSIEPSGASRGGGGFVFVNNRSSVVFTGADLSPYAYHRNALRGEEASDILFLEKRSLLLVGTHSGKVLVYAVNSQ